MTSSTNPEVALPSEEDRVTATVICLENLVKFGRVSEICDRTDRQTNKQTDTLIIILRTPTGGEVINAVQLYMQ